MKRRTFLKISAGALILPSFTDGCSTTAQANIPIGAATMITVHGKVPAGGCLDLYALPAGRSSPRPEDFVASLANRFDHESDLVTQPFRLPEGCEVLVAEGDGRVVDASTVERSYRSAGGE